MLSIPEDDDARHPTTIVARGNAPVKTRGVASNVHAKKLSVYREFDAPPDDDDVALKQMYAVGHPCTPTLREEASTEVDSDSDTR